MDGALRERGEYQPRRRDDDDRDADRCRPGTTGTMQTVNGDSLEAANSFRTPEAVTVRTTSFRTGPTFTIRLPPHSVSVLTLPLR